jgi:hypothetical protein
MHFLRVSASSRLRVEFLSVVAFAFALSPSLHAMDQIMLKSGTRVSGTIVAQSKDRVIMRVGQGAAVYSKKAIWRIYEDITDQSPITRVLKRDELPPWWVPLSDLYHEDWVNTLKSVPAGPIDHGDLHNVPYVSFRANRIYEMNIYGDPSDPAALEIGYYGNMWFASHDAQKRCRQFLGSYLTSLKQLQAIYQLNATGGELSVSGLTIKITPRSASDSFDGWWILVWNPAKLSAARCKDDAAWKLMCARNLASIAKFTTGKTEWTKYSLKDAAKRYLPMERMDER